MTSLGGILVSVVALGPRGKINFYLKININMKLICRFLGLFVEDGVYIYLYICIYLLILSATLGHSV